MFKTTVKNTITTRTHEELTSNEIELDSYQNRTLICEGHTSELTLTAM